MAPIAIKQATSYDYLLRQWQAQGWSQIRGAVLSQVPVGATSGRVLIPTQLDAFEWKDVSFMGVGNADDAIARLQAYIRAGGSELHAYALFKRTDVDFLGVRVTSYRLLLYHSIVQLAALAVVILAAAFAAVIFLQYIAQGTPPLDAVKQLWSGIVKPVQDGASSVIGQTTQGVAGIYIAATLAAGAIAIAFAQASKSTGAKISPPKGPSGSVGVRAGGVSARAST